MGRLKSAFAVLHDEAHTDDKVPFEHCQRQSCKDAHYALSLAAWYGED